MFTEEQIAIIRYCAEEVTRQRAGPDKVACLVEAWAYALRVAPMSPLPGLTDIPILGRLIEPYKNRQGFRTGDVFIGSRRGADPSTIKPFLVDLIEKLHDGAVNAEEFYRNYEEIHPFLDGNGRSGKVLYNWIKGTLAAPIMPPNFWNCANP